MDAAAGAHKHGVGQLESSRKVSDLVPLAAHRTVSPADWNLEELRARSLATDQGFLSAS
jgi:hypothetical protein